MTADQSIFERVGDSIVPTRHATSFWAADRLHGGPVQGLLAHAIEAAAPDPALICTRLTVDMFRPVPHAPLRVRTETVRQGARLAVLQASLFSEERELARATALLLRESAGAPLQPSAAAVADPAELRSESLFRGGKPGGFAQGFHTLVQTRWPVREPGQPLAIWFHMPLPLMAAEPCSAFQHVVSVSDFANAVASFAGGERGRPAPYINADATLYLQRRPAGEWFRLEEAGFSEERGISVARVSLADEHGPLGHILQARVLFQG